MRLASLPSTGSIRGFGWRPPRCSPVFAPEALLLDEPITGHDEDTCRRIMDILNEMQISTITVSHEYDFLARTTQQVFSIHQGKVQFTGSSAELHSHCHIHRAGTVPHVHAVSQPDRGAA